VAAGALGDGSRPVNVVWAVGGLLGVHLISLCCGFWGWRRLGADQDFPLAACLVVYGCSCQRLPTAAR